MRLDVVGGRGWFGAIAGPAAGTGMGMAARYIPNISFGRTTFTIRAAGSFSLTLALMCAWRSGDFLARFSALTVSNKAILGGVSNVT